MIGLHIIWRLRTLAFAALALAVFGAIEYPPVALSSFSPLTRFKRLLESGEVWRWTGHSVDSNFAHSPPFDFAHAARYDEGNLPLLAPAKQTKHSSRGRSFLTFPRQLEGGLLAHLLDFGAKQRSRLGRRDSPQGHFARGEPERQRQTQVIQLDRLFHRLLFQQPSPAQLWIEKHKNYSGPSSPSLQTVI